MKQNKDNQNKKQRSGFAVMCGLIGMIKPLLGIMCLAILMGCAGNLMATFLTILGGYALLTVTGVYSGMRLSVIFTLLVCFAVARAASIHDLIMSLPDGYETKIAELGSSLSGGERQRLGIARAFLHDADILFLDEPTSNIDSLNEGMILRSLKEECADKTILMVSHRKSTMGIADDVLEM